MSRPPCRSPSSPGRARSESWLSRTPCSPAKKVPAVPSPLSLGARDRHSAPIAASDYRDLYSLQRRKTLAWSPVRKKSCTAVRLSRKSRVRLSACSLWPAEQLFGLSKVKANKRFVQDCKRELAGYLLQ